jgi:hypothetical protein
VGFAPTSLFLEAPRQGAEKRADVSGQANTRQGIFANIGTWKTTGDAATKHRWKTVAVSFSHQRCQIELANLFAPKSAVSTFLLPFLPLVFTFSI